MSKPLVIAISGHAGSGKDTVAKYMQEYLEVCNQRTKITHFADLLKYVCKEFFNWDGSKDEHGRTMLQEIGTNVVRARAPNYWTDFIGDMITFFSFMWDYVIIPDARFPNEIQRLRERGFVVKHIRVERPGYTNDLTNEQNMHESEVSLDAAKPDCTIVNDGTLEDLRDKTINCSMEEIISNSLNKF